jgi:outer membrane protein OmpA-like peptidoglycan-associated protein
MVCGKYHTMKKTIPLVLFILLFAFCSQEKKLLRHAANSVERSDFDKAISYYDQVLQKDESSFFGNAGKGVVLSEFMGRHEQAIPYLEKALKNTPDKTKPILNSNLGKSYHFMGNYERALLYYGKSQKDNDPKWADYDEFLNKRIADCRYAIDHPKIALPENQQITNAGTTINTELPEYTPVVANGKMYFTSKRKDTPKEKKNGIDGKFFEAIYVSNINPDGSFSTPERYTLPKSSKGGEAIMSISPNGQKMFVYKGGKIYESDLNSPDHKTEVMDDNINFASLQNHASLTPDGKTLYFTSESDAGRGGTDIFIATKNSDGTWSDPKILDFTINTEFDEDAPFVNEAGTLFFSSNGHPGYGGFDVYKSNYVNGAWTKPENLGQPINSPGDDIYFTLRPNSSKGYYASARPGGHGDLDIYKVHYISSETAPCKGDDDLTINATPDLNNPMMQNVTLAVPDSYKNNVRSYRWDVNGQALAETSPSFQYTFPKTDTYKINAQIVVFCDSCPTLVAKCAQKEISVEQPPVLTSNDADNSRGKNNKNAKDKAAKEDKTALANNSAKNSKKQSSETDMTATTNADESTADHQAAGSGTGKKSKTAKDDLADNTNSGTKGSAGGKNKIETVSDNNGSSYTSNTGEAFLNDGQLKELNWNTTPAKFDFNTYVLNESTKGILDQNIEVMKNKNNLMVEINGYADSRGSSEYNKQLSLKRANSVKHYFVSHGIANKRIKSVNGLGEAELLNNCSDGVECSDDEHQVNRRVKVNVIAGPAKNNGSITSK